MPLYWVFSNLVLFIILLVMISVYGISYYDLVNKISFYNNLSFLNLCW